MSGDLEGEYVAFDLETTGLAPEIDRVVEIGAVRFDADGRELGQYQTLVNPQRPMSPTAQGVHGLSDADLADAPTAAEVLPGFLSFLGEAPRTTLLAHHAVFDAGVLGAELARADIATPAHSVIDTLSLARARLPQAPDHRLDTVARWLGLDVSDAHRALADCVRVQRLWLQLRPGAPASCLMAYPIFDAREPTPAPNGWDRLSEAAALKARVRMIYSGGSRGDTPREITPLGFANRGGVAYVIAFCHLDSFTKSFRLDRVRHYETVDAGDATTPGPVAVAVAGFRPLSVP